jgi:hypothetical protein
MPSTDPSAPSPYTIRLTTGEFAAFSQVDSSLDPETAEVQYRLLPPWITLNANVSLEMDGELIRGYLAIGTHRRWCYEQRAKNGKVLRFALLDDLPFSWESRVHEG